MSTSLQTEIAEAVRADEVAPDTKVCRKCNARKSTNHFSKNRANRDGLKNTCKQCDRALIQEWRDKNREHIREYNKTWRNENRDRELRRSAEWRQNNPERVREYQQRYNKTESRKTNSRRWRKSHSGKAWRHAYRLEPHTRAMAKRYDQSERRRQSMRKYRRSERGRVSTAQHNHRRRSLTQDGHVSAKEWRALVEKFQNACAYCGTSDVALTMDHVIPLSRGGRHSVSNIVPACLRCNSSKGSRTPEEWNGTSARNS